MYIRASDQAGWPSPGQLEKVVDRGLPLVELELVSNREAVALALGLELPQLFEPAIEVVECNPEPRLVAPGPGALELAEPRLDPAKTISV